MNPVHTSSLILFLRLSSHWFSVFSLNPINLFFFHFPPHSIINQWQWLLQSLMRLLRSILRATLVSERHWGPSTFLLLKLPKFLAPNAFSSSEPPIRSSKPPLSPVRFRRRLPCRPDRRLRLEHRWFLHLWVSRGLICIAAN